MSNPFTSTEAQMISAFSEQNPDVATTGFKRKSFIEFAESAGFCPKEANSLVYRKLNRVSRGIYTINAATVVNMPAPAAAPAPAAPAPTPPSAKTQVSVAVASTSDSEVYVPEKEPTFVRWGYFADVLKIIKSRMFYPMYVAGLSGNGKTMMIEQACAAANREYVRVQITPETDEDDLIGGFRLINGDTVFAKGPVIKAMEAGAILLIDEIDRGSNKLMCLQGVLEGKPVLIKKTGQVIKPASGFNVIATANTKGQGDEDGRFIAATIIDDAFLERFTVTLEQPYPSEAVERKIVANHMEKFGVNDDDFCSLLVRWGQAIRRTFADGGVDDIISTRRLCHIVQTFSIFGDRLKAIELCVNRFETDTRQAFIDLYTKVDADAANGSNEVAEESPEAPSEGVDLVSAVLSSASGYTI